MAKFKLSNDLPSCWRWARVDEVGAVRLGRQRSPSQQSGPSQTKYLRAGNIGEDGLDLVDVYQMDFSEAEIRRYALIPGDVVLAEASGSPRLVGRPAIWRGELALCCFQNTVIRFRPHAVTSEYALIVFRHYAATGAFADVARGIGIRHLGAARFGAMRMPVPPTEEQHRIVAAYDQRRSALDSAQADLASARRRSSELQTAVIAAGVNGSLISTLAPGSASSQSADEADVAWPRRSVAALGEVRLGKTLSRTARTGPDQRPYLRVANVQENYIDVHDVHRMHFASNEWERYRLEEGDVLLNEGQSPELVGRPAMYQGQPSDCGFQNTLLRFRSGALIRPAYALLAFRAFLHDGTFRAAARWSTNIAHLSASRLGRIEMRLPPLETQDAILAEVDQRLAIAMRQAAIVDRAQERIDELRLALTDAALSGRLGTGRHTDEPAEALLRKMGPPPVDVIILDPAVLAKSRAMEPPLDYADWPPVAAALAHAQRNMPLPDLCLAANYDLNDVGAIEAFYRELLIELEDRVEIVEDTAENAVIGLVGRAH